MAWINMPCCNASQLCMCGGWLQGLPFHRWESGGPLPGFFFKYKLWKGHFGIILKIPEKRFFTETGKKGFASQKRLKKRFENVSPGGLINLIQSSTKRVNTLRPRQNWRHFLNENIWLSIKISLKCPINNIPVLVQIMAWSRPGDKPLSKPMMI